MTEHPTPESDAAARAAQIAALTIALADAITHVRQERAAARAADDEHAATIARAARFTSHGTARLAWAPAFDERWLRNADVHAVLDAWAPAVGWADTDTAARDAAALIEQRLADAFPAAMHRYAQARTKGHDPATAMGQAAPLFAVIDAPPADAVHPPRQITAAPARAAERPTSRRR
jgi:hypothetical protein